MKKWEKLMDGTTISFHLTKKASPLWYAKVFKYGTGWSFSFGRREGITVNEKDVVGEKTERYNSTKSWKNADTAKAMATEALRNHFIF